MFFKKYVTAIIVAAGKGTRKESEIPKQYMTIAGKTILELTLYKFEKNKYIDEIILVVNKEDIDYVRTSIACNFDKIKRVLQGGKTRTESVYEGIKMAAENSDLLLIHDGVRPFVSYKLINTCIESASEYKACIPVIDVTDTIKEVNDGFVEKTMDRSRLKAVQTPQAFDYHLIRECYDRIMLEDKEKFSFTDDASIVEHCGYKIKAIDGLSRNIKITTPLDLRIAEILSSIY